MHSRGICKLLSWVLNSWPYLYYCILHHWCNFAVKSMWILLVTICNGKPYQNLDTDNPDWMCDLIPSVDCLTVHQPKCHPYCLTCRWQTLGVRIICWFCGDGCDQTNINYSHTDSRLGSHSLFTAHHQLPCESYWKVNEEWRDMKAAQTSCHSSVRLVFVCMFVCMGASRQVAATDEGVPAIS